MNLTAEKLHLAQRLLATENEEIVKAIKSLFKEEEYEFDMSMKAEIDRRLDKLEKGKSKLYTWHEIKKSIGKKK
jgi:putative addiction module component (TIGR02574 family)